MALNFFLNFWEKRNNLLNYSIFRRDFDWDLAAIQIMGNKRNLRSGNILPFQKLRSGNISLCNSKIFNNLLKNPKSHLHYRLTQRRRDLACADFI